MLEVMINQKKKKKKKKKKKILSIYLNNKGRHEVSDVELLIVLPFKKPFNIGKTTPPRVVLSICHGVWGKHELRRVHQNLWVILTYQLTLHPLYQV